MPQRETTWTCPECGDSITGDIDTVGAFGQTHYVKHRVGDSDGE